VIPCYLKDKSEPLLKDIKDKSELLRRGAKLGTVFLIQDKEAKVMDQVHKRLTNEEVKQSSSATSAKR